jgi:hypothetical protein
LSARIAIWVAVVAAVLAAASSANAAFPGRNGLLAVQPLHGNGIVLVAYGGQSRRICTDVAVCGHPVRPRFSPDGRSLVFAGPAIRLIATDGTCQNCRFGVAPNPAVMPSGNMVTFVSGGVLAVDGVDGIRLATLIRSVSDAVWSASGKLAVVRHGGVWEGTPGKLRALGRGSSPSWSPNGTRLAFVRGGWITVASLSGGADRRLARGGSPAFSPDGKWIAFIDPSRRLQVIGSFGGRARTVGTVRGLAVDWQPVPAHPAACVAPPGAKVIAQSSQGVVTTEAGPNPGDGVMLAQTAAMGCLFADGRERLLEQTPFNSIDGATEYPMAALGGTYAAVMTHDYDEHYDSVDDQKVDVFDLRTGAASGFGGESALGCPEDVATCSTIDQVVVGSQGGSAVHIIDESAPPSGCTPSPCRMERIVASDRAGVQTVATSAFDPQTGPQLTGLTLTGSTLSWSDHGSPKSVQLTL